ncbi:hypothetical protein O3M35_000767 [Rhynocoris fuscipes]|uniref:ATP-dependent DNA helicase n=1 Tax=Rhynocoris fuscipes TaxID=488301 RepID=A0AAW1DS80_9HEMI
MPDLSNDVANSLRQKLFALELLIIDEISMYDCNIDLDYIKGLVKSYGAYHFPNTTTNHDLSGHGPRFVEYFYDNALTQFDIKNVLFTPPKTKDVGETTVAHFKKKVIGSRSRFVIKWNPKCDTIDSPDILVESDTAGKFFNNIKAHRAPPLLYIRPFNAEDKNENIVDGYVKRFGKDKLLCVLWILDSFDIHQVRHINPGGISKRDADKIGGYYNSKYNEENFEGAAYHFPPNLINDLTASGNRVVEYFYENAATKNDVTSNLWTPPKTKDLGETTVAHFKNKVITPKTRFRCKWNPKADTFVASGILEDSDKLLKKVHINKLLPLLYIRPFNAEFKNTNIKDGTQMFVTYLTCRLRTYYRFLFSGRIYSEVV